MKLLIDTNIFLEVILEQERAEESRELLSKIEQHELFISDFSLHSIGLLLFRRNRHDIFRQFLDDMLLRAGMSVLTVATKKARPRCSASFFRPHRQRATRNRA